MVSSLLAGIRAPSFSTRDLMPEGLTQTKTPTFSETRPEIDRNGGRLHFGMVAGFKSERWPASRRNTRPE
jgi:hypothetical protein